MFAKFLFAAPLGLLLFANLNLLGMEATKQQEDYTPMIMLVADLCLDKPELTKSIGNHLLTENPNLSEYKQLIALFVRKKAIKPGWLALPTNFVKSIWRYIKPVCIKRRLQNTCRCTEFLSSPCGNAPMEIDSSRCEIHRDKPTPCPQCPLM